MNRAFKVIQSHPYWCVKIRVVEKTLDNLSVAAWSSQPDNVRSVSPAPGRRTWVEVWQLVGRPQGDTDSWCLVGRRRGTADWRDVLTVRCVSSPRTSPSPPSLQKNNRFKYMICGNIVWLTGWNSLPDFVVLSLTIILMFKHRLDNFWKSRDIIHDFETQAHGIRNSSEV